MLVTTPTSGATIRSYESDTLVSFENIGELVPTTTVFKLQVHVDVHEIIDLARTTQEFLQTIKNSSCMRHEKYPCEATFAKFQERANEAAEIISEIMGLRDESPTRQKRAILDFLGEGLAHLIGLTDKHQRKSIEHDVKDLQDGQDEVVEQMITAKELSTKAFDELVATEKFLKNITETFEDQVNNLTWDLRAAYDEQEAFQQLWVAVSTLERKSEAMLSVIANKKLSPKLISPGKLNNILSTIKAKAQVQVPFNDMLEITTQTKATVEISPTALTFKVTIEIPASDDVNEWTLFKLHTRPMIERDTISMLETEFRFITTNTLGEAANLKSTDGCLRNHQGIFICALLNPIMRKNENCVANALTARLIGKKSCSQIIHSATFDAEMIIRLELNALVVITTQPITIQMKCAHQPMTETTIKSHSIVEANEPCKMTINNSTFFLINTVTERAMTHISAKMEFQLQQEINTKNLPALPHFTSEHIEEVEQLGMRIKELNERHFNIRTNSIEDDIKKVTTTSMKCLYTAGMVLVALIILIILRKIFC